MQKSRIQNNKKINTVTPKKMETSFKGISSTKNLKVISKLTNYEKNVNKYPHTPKDQLLRPCKTTVIINIEKNIFRPS